MIAAEKKNKSGILSILPSSNEAYSVGESSFMGIGRGSLLQIDGFTDLVTVSSCDKKEFYFKFSKKNDYEIVLNRDVGAVLSQGDYLSILSSTYETLGLSDFIDRGSGYKEGDLLEIKSGKPTKNISTNLINNAVFEVKETTESGAVKKLKVHSKGEYVEPPEEECELFGGNGFGIKISLFFEEKNEKRLIERQIKEINRTPIETYISLDSPLYDCSKNGEFKISKWKAILNTNYFGAKGFSLKFRTCDNVTEYLKLPLLPPNAHNAEAVYNKVITQLDKKIEELENRIKLLESRS